MRIEQRTGTRALPGIRLSSPNGSPKVEPLRNHTKTIRQMKRETFLEKSFGEEIR